MDLVSGRSSLFSFQGTATRYLPFSYLRESFTLPKASLSSSVSTSLPSQSEPNFSRLVDVTTGFFSLAPYRFSSEQGTDNVRSCSRGLVFVRRTNTAQPKWSVSGDGSTIFSTEINVRIMELSVINANQKMDKPIICRLGKIALGQMPPFILMVLPVHNSVISADTFLGLFPLKTCHLHFRF